MDNPQTDSNNPLSGAEPAAKDPNPTTTGSTRALNRQLQRRAKRRKILRGSAIGLALAAVLGGGGTYLALGTVTVPDAEQYNAELTSTDPCASYSGIVDSCSVKFVHSDSVVRDRIIDQSVAAGFSLVRPSSIELTYSSGPVESTFPDIVRQDYDEAVKELYLSGVEVSEVVPVDRDDLGANRIVSSSIPAGTTVESGTKVTLEVSTETVDMPSLSGLTKEQAELDLQKLGLEAEFVEESSPEPAGTVIRQSPSADAVAKGSTVTVTIAKSETVVSIKVPSVVGLTEEEAQSVIASAGFKNIAVVKVPSSKVTEARVSHVVPGEGRTVRSDSNVVLVVSIPEVQQ